MKFGVITFPGSNCDQDLVYVLETIHGCRVEKLWHKDHDLKGVDFVFLPGGFSYGDYLRSGAIARFSPIMQEVIRFAGNGGYVMGICNGFQILTESGLLPGALLHNGGQQFRCENVHLRVETTQSIVTSAYDKNEVIKIPIAHGEGRYFASPETLEEIYAGDQVLFRYCDPTGKASGLHNPNGSIDDIAGICNAGRNVFGMMPHPERADDEKLSNTDGRKLFESILSVVLEHR